MGNAPSFSQEFVRKVLKYSPRTGRLTWRRRPESMFSGPHQHRTFLIWNGRYANTPAFTCKCLASPNSTTFIFLGSLQHKTYKAHQIAYFWMTGDWPLEIDHADGDGLNNRWSNIKDGLHSDNMRNRRSQYTYAGIPVKCPHPGVQEQPDGRFRAYITINGKRLMSPRVVDLAVAIAMRKQLKKDHGFSERHCLPHRT